MRIHTRELMNSGELGAICFLETKTTECGALLKMAERRGFNSFFIFEPLGFTGGLLLVWNKDRIMIDVVDYST